MRSPAPLLLVATLALAACSGGDDAPAAADTTAAPSTTAIVADGPVTIDECEDAPDPADYVEGQIPPAVRPCEIPSELVVHTIRDGVGRAAEPGDTIFADYTGIRSETGLVFDTSYTRGEPLDFPIGRGGVIQGWDDGLIGARPGSMYKLDIPADLAYGDNPPGGGAGEIQAGDALTFLIEVRAVVPPVTADDAPLDVDVEPSTGAVDITVVELVEGDGASVELGGRAIVHVLLVRGDNQVVLFNSWERDQVLPILMEEGQTLPGLFEGIQGARVGSLRTITMPPDDAFGPTGEPSLGLPAATDLIAVVEVVGAF